MKNTRCSIIIRSYNEERHIGRLLEGIGHQILHAEVILVDSGSTDATVAIASRYPVRIISIDKEDFSFGHSLNVGCKAASGPYLVFASAHVYPVYKDWLECLLKPFEDDRIALVYGKQRGNEVTSFSEHQVFARWFPDEPTRNQEHPFCNNANAAIRRSLWERFPFDETLTGLEDLAWAKVVMREGYRLAYEPNASIIHVHDESPRMLFNRYRREAIALKQLFPGERFGIGAFFRRFIQNVSSDSWHAMQQGVFGRSFRSILVFRLMQYWGTYRGFAQRGPIPRELQQRFYYPNELPRRSDEPSTRSDDPSPINYADTSDGETGA